MPLMSSGSMTISHEIKSKAFNITLTSCNVMPTKKVRYFYFDTLC